MTITRTIQGVEKDYVASFYTGEISREFWADLPTQPRSLSAKLITNFIVMQSGALRKRLGTLLLEVSDKDMFTMTWGDKDIIFREKTDGIGAFLAEHRIYQGTTPLTDWIGSNILTILRMSDIKRANILASSPNKIMFSTAHGIFSINPAGVATKEAITFTLPGGTEPTDWTHSTIFNNSLVVAENGRISVSQPGKLFEFTQAGSSPNLMRDGLQEIFDRLTLSGETVTNLIADSGKMVLTTDLNIYTVQFFVDAGAVIYSLRLEANYGVKEDCAIFYGHDFFFTTKDGLYWMDNSVLGRPSYDRLGSFRDASTTGQVVLLSAYCRHVFDKEHIKLGMRMRENPRILYSLREDGTIINFTLRPEIISGQRIPLVAATRRTCEGEYSWIPQGGMQTVMSRRYIEGVGMRNVVEREVFLEWAEDNEAQPVPSCAPGYGDNHIYYDCGRVWNGGLWVTGKKVADGYEVSKSTGILTNDYIEYDNNSQTQVTDIDYPAGGKKILKGEFPNAGKEIFINGKVGYVLSTEWLLLASDFGTLHKTYVVEGTYFREVINGQDANTKGVRVAAGLDYSASIRMLHASDIGIRTQRTRARIFTVDTQEIIMQRLIYGRNKRPMPTAISTERSVQSGYFVAELNEYDSDRLSLEDLEIIAVPGYSCSILAIGFEIATSVQKDY